VAAPDLNPAEHFRQLRQVLIDNDNLLGPLRTIATVESQISAMQQLRQGHRGADARELMHIQTQYAEFCGWLHHDAGDFRSSQYWLDRALEWSYATGERDTTTYILARKSQLAGDMFDAMTAVDLATAAGTQARPDTRLSAIAATYGAYGYALTGDAHNSARELDRAHDLLTNLDPDPSSPWGAWMDSAYLEVHRARNLYALGHPAQAAEGFRTAIAALPAGYHRDRGVYLARESLAYAGAHEPEQAQSSRCPSLASTSTRNSVGSNLNSLNGDPKSTTISTTFRPSTEKTAGKSLKSPEPGLNWVLVLRQGRGSGVPGSSRNRRRRFWTTIGFAPVLYRTKGSRI
jgi:tetratricopeptide (TPR) repeat protein